MSRLKPILLFGIILFSGLIISCADKNPSREEIPRIRNLLGRFEAAVRDKDAVTMDSLIAAEAYQLGYTSQKILTDIYSVSENNSFYKFAQREFFYTAKKGTVHCVILPDSAASGAPAEITVIKLGDIWLVKRFDLK